MISIRTAERQPLILGPQAGVKSADLVLCMTSNKAKRSIEEGAFELGGEFCAVAGSFDQTFTASKNGVVAYTQADGVFTGASLGGVGISHDKDEERAFYGSYDARSIFEGKIPPKVGNAIQELRGMLPPS